MKTCDQCGTTPLPMIIPGLMNKSLVTIAEFCSDECRKEWQTSHSKKEE